MLSTKKSGYFSALRKSIGAAIFKKAILKKQIFHIMLQKAFQPSVFYVSKMFHLISLFVCFDGSNVKQLFGIHKKKFHLNHWKTNI